MGAAAPLTKAIMDSWKPWELATVKLTELAEAIRENSQAAESTVDRIPSDSWSGAARSAANARAGDQHGWAKSVAARVEDLQTAITEAAAAIDSGREAVNGALLGASLQRFMLISENDPSWAMRYVPQEDDDLTPGEIAAKEREMTSFIKSKADELATTAADQAALIKAAVDNVDTIAPPGLTLSAQDGRRHAHMAEDGWTDEEAASVGRSLSAAGLTDDQIRRLMNGEKLDDVPRGVQEYLHTFYAGLGSDDLFSLKTKFDAMNSPTAHSWSSALGRGLVTLSNENVGDNTGYQYLPRWVQDWAGSHNPLDDKRVRQLDIPLAGLLGNSGTVPPGEKFGTELIRKSAGGAGRSVENGGIAHPEIIYGSGTDDLDTLKRNYETTIRQFMEVGTRNHEASAAILTGEYASGERLADYNREQMLENIFKFDWDDGGQSAGGLVDWIRGYGSSSDSSHVALADRAFTSLYDFATSTDGDNNFRGLMNANSSGDAIGKINPHLAGALREASLPYLNILAGGDSETYGHPGFDPPGDSADIQRRTARLFTLIASDNTYGAPTAENPDGTGAGADLYRDILEQSVRNGAVAGNEFEIDPDRARSLARISASLRELGQAGLYGAEYDLQIDENVNTDEENAAGAKVRNIVSSASAGLTAVPHPAAIAAGATGTAAAPWLLPASSAGDIPFSPPTGTAGGGEDYDTATHDEIRLAYGALSTVDGIPDIGGKSESWYDASGQLKPLPDILAEHNGDADELLSAMERALPDDLTASFRAGSGTGKDQGRRNFDPTDPDNYDDMILNGS